MSKRPHVKLSENEHQELKALLSKGNLNVRTYRRASALLQLHEMATYTEVAKQLGVTKQTVSTWAAKYQEGQLDFLNDKPRTGRPKKILSIDEAKIVALACSEPPEGYERWSLRLLADYAGELAETEPIYDSGVRRILKKTNLNRT